MSNCWNYYKICRPNGPVSQGRLQLPTAIKRAKRKRAAKLQMPKDITIPNSVIWINYTAFGECISLTSITIPSSVTRIETAAFWGCKNLKSITILNANAYVSFDVFEECSSLEEIRVPAGSTDRFKDLFYDDELKKLIVEI